MRSTQQAGYSAVEVLAGATLLAMFAAISVPSVLKGVAAFKRNGSARHVMAEIRHAQSLAVSRGGVFGLQWGAPVARPDGEYRIVRDTNGACALPAVTAAPDGTNVIRFWTDVNKEYPGTRISTIRDNNNMTVGTLMFNSRGMAVNTCSSVAFPITVTVIDSDGRTRSIEVRSAGSIRLL